MIHHADHGSHNVSAIDIVIAFNGMRSDRAIEGRRAGVARHQHGPVRRPGLTREREDKDEQNNSIEPSHQ